MALKIEHMLHSVVSGALVTTGIFMQHGLRWVSLVVGLALFVVALLGFSPIRAMLRSPRRIRSGAVFVATPCSSHPSKLQWTRVEYQGHGLQRIESDLKVLGRVPPLESRS